MIVKTQYLLLIRYCNNIFRIIRNYFNKHFKKHKNLVKNSFKTKLNKYDIALIQFCHNIGIDIKKNNYYNYNVYDEVVSSIIPETYLDIISILFCKFTQKYKQEYNTIALKLFITVLQDCKLVYEYKYVYSEYFQRIAKRYESSKFKDCCLCYIKTSWVKCFFFNPIFFKYSPEFSSEYIKYISNMKYKNYNYNNCNYNYNLNTLQLHFKNLEIDYTTDLNLIKAAYRKLCFKYHPDKGGSEDLFIKINNSYNYIISHIN